MRLNSLILVAALAGGGLLALGPVTADAQGRGGAQPRPPQGTGRGPTAGPAQGHPGSGPASPGRPVYGRPGGGGGPVYGRPGQGYGRPGYPGRGVYSYGYYRPSYLYSPWGWYPWYPWGFYGYYGGFSAGYGWYGPYSPYGYYAYNGSSLKLEVQPKDAEVFIDGHLAGKVDDFDGFFQRLTVDAGGHDVTIYKPGFRTVTQNIYLQPGSTFKLKYVMEPLGAGEAAEPPPAPRPDPKPEPEEHQRWLAPPRQAPPVGEPQQQPPPAPRIEAESRYGQFAIRVQPEGAQVFIDGEAWQGPRGIDRLVVHLPAGTHRLEVRKDGYEPFVAEFEIKPGETTALNVSLVGLDVGDGR